MREDERTGDETKGDKRRGKEARGKDKKRRWEKREMRGDKEDGRKNKINLEESFEGEEMRREEWR